MDTEKLDIYVQRAKLGDKQAHAVLYNEYYDKIYCFVLKNVRNKADAEDITQETFVKSMKKIGELKDSAKYDSWLFSIAYNGCIDHFRDAKHCAHFDSDEERERASAELALNEPLMLPEDYSVNEERKQYIRKVIDELKPDMRSAVILYYYDNLSIASVADKLGIKENAVKQRLFAARKKMRKKFDAMSSEGAVLSAVPVGSMLLSALPPEYAKNTAAYAGVSSAIPVKVLAVSAAAVMAAGVPLGYALSDNNNNDYGDFGNSEVYDSEPSSDTDSEMTAEPLYSNTLDELLSMTVDEALKIGGSYQITDFAYDDFGISNTDYDMVFDYYQCENFPEYCFNSTLSPTHRINKIQALEGAELGGGVTVGDSWNEIEQAIGEDLSASIFTANESVIVCTDVDGRQWWIEFDLSPYEGLYEKARDENILDLSEYDIKSLTAVFSGCTFVNAEVDKIMSKPVDDVLKYYVDDYELVDAKGVPDGKQVKLYRCYTHPSFAFGSMDGENGLTDIINIYHGEQGSIDGIIEDVIAVGSNYNHIKQQMYYSDDPLGDQWIGVKKTDDDLEYALFLTLNGRVWEIGFDLSEEDKALIAQRLEESGGEPVDISDIDPVSTIGVFRADLNYNSEDPSDESG